MNYNPFVPDVDGNIINYNNEIINPLLSQNILNFGTGLDTDLNFGSGIDRESGIDFSTSFDHDTAYDFGMTNADIMFIISLITVVLIIVFFNKPMISIAIDSIQHDITNNAVIDYIMASVSQSYVLQKKNAELSAILTKIKSPFETSAKIIQLKKTIDIDIENSIDTEIKNVILNKASKYAIASGDRIRPIIAYSIVNRLRKSRAKGKKENDLVGDANNVNNIDTAIFRNCDIENLNAIEFIHSASLIVDDITNDGNHHKSKIATHKTYGLDIALLSAAQLTITAFKLVSRVDRQIKKYLIETIDKKRNEADKKDTKDTKDTNILSATKSNIFDSFMRYDIIISVIYDTSDLIDGRMLDNRNKSNTRDMALNTIGKKTASIFTMNFEMAWVIGGGIVTHKSIDSIRSISTDFGIMYQIYNDFCNYYSDQNNTTRKNDINYLVSMGVDEAYDEFYYRMSEFIRKAEHLDIMTNTIKHISNYLSDAVGIAHAYIIKDEKIDIVDSSTDDFDEITDEENHGEEYGDDYEYDHEEDYED